MIKTKRERERKEEKRERKKVQTETWSTHVSLAMATRTSLLPALSFRRMSGAARSTFDQGFGLAVYSNQYTPRGFLLSYNMDHKAKVPCLGGVGAGRGWGWGGVGGVEVEDKEEGGWRW